MSILKITQLTQGFGEKILYKNAMLQVNQGEHLGITGQNGVGKSTLIKLLTGELLPDEGKIQWQPKIKIGYLDQQVTVQGTQTIKEFLQQAYESLYLIEKKVHSLYTLYSETGMECQLEQAGKLQTQLDESVFYHIDTIIKELANGLGLTAIGLDRPIQMLSGGQRSKVILAKLLLEKPDVLLLDEPTNYLDDSHIDWLIEYLTQFSGTFLLVSHDDHFLNAVATSICDIEFGRLTKYTGNVNKAFQQKEKNKETYLKHYQAQQATIEKTEAYIRKYKAGNRATMAKSRQKKLDRLQRLTPPEINVKPKLQFAYHPVIATTGVEMTQLLVGYKEPLFLPINLVIQQGEKVAIKGFNGIGKSTLIKTLTGQLPALAGNYHYPEQTIIGYFSQELVWENSQENALTYLRTHFPTRSVKELRSNLAKSGLSDKLVEQPIELLSGGEQTKLKICCLMLQPSTILFLDEPTNHIDNLTKTSLQQAIQAFQGTVVIVSHETAFYSKIVDRVIDIEELA